MYIHNNKNRNLSSIDEANDVDCTCILTIQQDSSASNGGRTDG